MLAALGAGLLLVLALWVHLRLTVRWLTRAPTYALEEELATPDGAKLELRRVGVSDGAANDGAGADAVPVLLVHGISANHRNLDLERESSLARYLAERGRDVWLLTLRSGRRFRWREAWAPQGFGPMARHDVPLAVARVLERTGARAVDYVGFSMGGMVLYAALGRHLPERRLRRAVLIASPGRVPPPRGVPRWLRLLPPVLVPRILTGLLGTVLAFGAEWFVTPVHRAVLNPANVAPGVIRLALVDCIEDVPGRLLADFMGWATTTGELRVEGENVIDRLRQVQVPALFLVGEADRVAPVEAVRVAYDAWGAEAAGETRQWAVIGADSGAAQPYGHGDLAVGHRLRRDLFPRIDRFLAEADEAADAVEEVAVRTLVGPERAQLGG